jgi:hypothetical protein
MSNDVVVVFGDLLGDFERRAVSTVVDCPTTVVHREPKLPLARTFRFTALMDHPGAVVIHDDLLALQYLLIDADDVALLAQHWDEVGTYVLVDLPRWLSWNGYAGQSQELKTRLPRHRAKRPHLNRVLLVRRTTERGFTSTQIAIPERLLALDLGASEFAKRDNGKLPEGAVAPDYEADHCHAFLESMRTVLRILGYPLYRGVA